MSCTNPQHAKLKRCVKVRRTIRKHSMSLMDKQAQRGLDGLFAWASKDRIYGNGRSDFGIALFKERGL